MKQIFGLFALLLGVCAANAQTADTVKYAAGNDLYRGITRKLPYRQMVTPYGVEVTFAKTVHIIFPAAVRYVDVYKRQAVINNAYKSLLNYRNLVNYYTRKNISVSYLRAKKKNDTDRVLALYGSADERYW